MALLLPATCALVQFTSSLRRPGKAICLAGSPRNEWTFPRVVRTAASKLRVRAAAGAGCLARGRRGRR